MYPHCPICYDELRRELEITPISLLCGHALCSDCFASVFDLPMICPLKCPVTSRTGIELNFTSREVSSTCADILDAAILRRDASLKSSITLSDERCTKLVEDCHKLGQKMCVQQRRIEAHRASLEKVHMQAKHAEEERLELLSRYQAHMLRKDDEQRAELLKSSVFKRSRSQQDGEPDGSAPAHRPKRSRSDAES
ncbi:hypothetical protein C8Q73DRAFT_696681 [Cubamyces lactineus]|nr:hypothetical protein C8Q73DRAFT_696681 [Cubamyces lactineus]